MAPRDRPPAFVRERRMTRDASVGPGRRDLNPTLDVAANRSAKKWTARENAIRIAWALVQPLFRFSPRPLWHWRATLLRAFGARIGRNVHVYPSVRIAIPWTLTIGDDSAIGDGAIVYSLGQITIGRAVTVSQHVHLCAGTHDHRRPDFPLLKPPITVGDGAWLCADVYVGPGVVIGEAAIAAARAVVIRDLPPRCIAAGNPAAVKRYREPPAK